MGLAALCLGWTGCSPGDRSEAGGSPRPAPAQAAQPTPPPPAAKPEAAASPTPALGGAEAAEAWSESVKAQWSQIAKRLSKPESAADGTLFADHITMPDTAGWEVKALYEGAPLGVEEVTPSPSHPPAEGIQATPEEFTRRLRELLYLADDDGATPAVRVKLFGISRDGAQLKTRQRLTARGRRSGHEVRTLAVVEARWDMPPGGDPPRLAALSTAKLTRSGFVSDQGTRFEDMASRVLGSTPAWREQLQVGMNTWVRRIDRSLKPDFLGYHGLAIGDVNGDDREDLYLCQPGGLPNLLFLQQPDGTLADASATSGADWLDNSTGALLVDLDNDGDKDLAVATQRAFLLMENDGAGTFTLRTRLPELGLGYSPTAADYDLDGDLDLLVLRYGADSREAGGFPTPHPFYDARNGGANVLLENRGGFQFADVTNERGLGVGNYRFSFAASWEDYDNDGDVDVYIANDFGPNQLFRNDKGLFVDVSTESGTQDWGFGMSATWGDYDRNGFMDLYVSNMFSGAGSQIVPQSDFNPSMNEETRAKYLKMVRGNSLLRNGGQGRFADVTDPMAEGFGSWAWGAKFGDLNNDGWEDVYVANGYISQPDKDDL